MSLYLTGVYMDDDRRAELERAFADAGKKLDAGKSCVRFRKVDDLPLDVIGDCIAADPMEDFVARFQGIQSARKAKSKQTRSKTKPAPRKTSASARKKQASGRTTK